MFNMTLFNMIISQICHCRVLLKYLPHTSILKLPCCPLSQHIKNATFPLNILQTDNFHH